MDEIKQDFLESLGELTFNSRPIIQTLTTIADENKEFAPAVVEAVQQHILASPPPLKLPAIYLMDSICKNIRVPYVDLFASKVYQIFSDSFSAVPEPIRVKLGELFRTWTIPGPDGEPLFPHEILRQIDNFLGRARNQSNQSKPSRGVLNQTVLLVEVNRTLKEADALESGREADQIRGVLTRLQAALSAPGVDPSIFLSIQQQLDNFHGRIQHLASRARKRGGGGPMRNGNSNKRSKGSNGRNERNDITGSNQVPLGPRKPVLEGIDFAKLAQSINVLKEKPAEPAEPATPDLPSLLSNLQKSGLVTLTATVELSTAGLAAPHPELIAKLYGDRPVQCATCGMRFIDDEAGRAAKEREMDWHFRVNKEIQQGRSRNRVWYLTLDEWVAYRDEEEVEGTTQDTEPTEDVVDLEAEALKYVPVPTDTSQTACPVCQDKFNAVYSEDAEEWVWINAVEVNGTYFNATCYADPNNQQVVAQVLNS